MYVTPNTAQSSSICVNLPVFPSVELAVNRRRYLQVKGIAPWWRVRSRKERRWYCDT